MKIKGVLFVLSFILLISFCTSATIEYPTFYENALEAKIKKSIDSSLIIFTASYGCHQCEMILPIIDKLKAHYKGKNLVEVVDCIKYRDFCARNNGRPPMMSMFKKYAIQINYVVNNFTTIMNWFDSKSIFFGTLLESEEDIEKFKKVNKRYAIGYFPLGITDKFRIYDSTAVGETSNNYKFGLVRQKKLMEGNVREEKIIFNNGFDEPFTFSSSQIPTSNVSKLQELFTLYSRPLIVELNQDTFQKSIEAYTQMNREIFISFVETNDLQNKQLYLDTLRNVSANFRQFSFAYMPYETNLDVLDSFQVPNRSPQSILRLSFDNLEDTFYIPPNPFTVDSISRWIREIQHI
eukprot:TRINITY_DN1321_c0_g3_i1.p1 TRINITY_DN1321_c0_g3~~TRINITY_DN1321_c0_g3_i1.p1  ORF type:complete len:350 (+),score=77.98 TRINITY_DN1321_c0_g3_i1:45-1094(+)